MRHEKTYRKYAPRRAIMGKFTLFGVTFHFLTGTGELFFRIRNKM